jgi:hypothetical protein
MASGAYYGFKENAASPDLLLSSAFAEQRPLVPVGEENNLLNKTLLDLFFFAMNSSCWYSHCFPRLMSNSDRWFPTGVSVPRPEGHTPQKGRSTNRQKDKDNFR